MKLWVTWYAMYSALLTQGQQDYFEDYYYNDLSLGEIADNRHVSRQAVYDNLRRSAKSLEKYEDKLRLLASYSQLEEGISQALASLAPVTRKRPNCRWKTCCR